jgi:hypothetical protein
VIQIGFSTHPGNWISAMIRFFTKSKVSHAWILLDDDYFGTKMVMEAVGIGGFRMVTYKTWLAEGNKVVQLINPLVPLDTSVKAAIDWLGDSYDRLGFWGYAWVLFGRWMKKRWRNPFRSSKEMTCSEAVTRIVQAANWPGAEELDPESTDPQTLMVFLLANNPQ